MNQYDEECIDDSVLSNLSLTPTTRNVHVYKNESESSPSFPSTVDMTAALLFPDLDSERQKIHELFQSAYDKDAEAEIEAEAEMQKQVEEQENGNNHMLNQLPTPMRVYSLMGQKKDGLSLPELLTYWDIVKDEAAKKRSYIERINHHCLKWGQVALDPSEAKKKISYWADNEKKILKPLVLPPPLNLEKLSFLQAGYIPSGLRKASSSSSSSSSASSNPIQSSLVNIQTKKVTSENREINLFELCKPKDLASILIPLDKIRSIASWMKKVLDKDPPTVGIAVIHGRTGIGKKEALSLILKPLSLNVFYIFFSQENPEVHLLNRLSSNVDHSKRCFIITDCDIQDNGEQKET